jgi:cyclopropane fatty-acyl-phospholipid synthase-like methyltransferase
VQDLVARLSLDQFPRSARYDPGWVMKNLMGPNVLWLAEAMSQVMTLEPGMRVLDMGCGKALSSIFLTREFGVRVWATDLWIAATDNWQRICAAGLQDQITPIHAEAHALPFADGFFDAAISLDAYHYFGTNDLYLGYYSRFVRPGGQIGIVVPGLDHEFSESVPEHLAPYWERDFWSFHSPTWWRRLWERTGLVEIAQADLVPHGWEHWLRWLEVCAAQGARHSPQEAEMLRVDAGRNLGFSRVLARRREA